MLYLKPRSIDLDAARALVKCLKSGELWCGHSSVVTNKEMNIQYQIIQNADLWLNQADHLKNAAFHFNRILCRTEVYFFVP